MIIDVCLKCQLYFKKRNKINYLQSIIRIFSGGFYYYRVSNFYIRFRGICLHATIKVASRRNLPLTLED